MRKTSSLRESTPMSSVRHFRASILTVVTGISTLLASCYPLPVDQSMSEELLLYLALVGYPRTNRIDWANTTGHTPDSFRWIFGDGTSRPGQSLPDAETSSLARYENGFAAASGGKVSTFTLTGERIREFAISTETYHSSFRSNSKQLPFAYCSEFCP